MINYQYFRVFSAPRGWTKWNSVGEPSFQTIGFSNRVYCWTNGVWEKCSCFLPSVSTWNSRLQSMCATGESIQHSCHCQITKFWSDRQFFPVARKDIDVTWKTHNPQGSVWTDFHGAREGPLLYRDRDGQTKVRVSAVQVWAGADRQGNAMAIKWCPSKIEFRIKVGRCLLNYVLSPNFVNMLYCHPIWRPDIIIQCCEHDVVYVLKRKHAQSRWGDQERMLMSMVSTYTCCSCFCE